MMGGLDHSFIKAYGAPMAVMSPASIADTTESRPVAAPWPASHAPVPTPHARFASEVSRNPVPAAVSTAMAAASAPPTAAWSVSFSTFDTPLITEAAAVYPGAAASEPVGAIAPKREMRVAEPNRQNLADLAPPRPHVFQSAPTFQPEPIRPMLEVEHFLWPDVVSDLRQRVAGPLRELAAEFSAASAGGCRVLLFVGERRGAGVTSLVLASARQLAQHGLRVAVVDANFAGPDLAAYLGIAAQVGWEDVLARQSSLADALVESTCDRLTLLPLKFPVSPHEAPLDLSLASENLKQLRRGYDLVLVDGGALEDAATRMLLARLANGALEGIVSVCDARGPGDGQASTDPAARQVVDRLLIGTIENFAA
jgi:Mrp family chromosome partitioning ATPase